MAWSIEEFEELGGLLVEIQDQGGPVDPESQKYKQIERLLRKLEQAYNRSPVAELDADVILGDLERRRTLAKRRGEIYQSATETKKQLIQYGQRAERILREKIKLLYISDENTEDEIKNLQEELKVLHKSNKENAADVAGVEKGAQVAEQILQSTFGISKHSTDIMGSVKGFAKGLKKSLTAANLFATAVSKVFDAYGGLQDARAKLFKQTGLQGYDERIIDVGDKLSMAYGENSKQIAGELFTEVNQARRAFMQYSKADMDRIVFTAGQLSKLGVSVSAYSDIGTFMSLNLEQNLDEQEKTLGMLYDLGKQTGTSPEKMFREVATSLPVYSRYTKGFASVFAGIHLAAQRTNVDISDLMTLTESLDSSDEALKQAQKFNALLGGQYLNPVELLAADPGEKVKLIAEAYQRANQSLGDIHPRVVRSLYQNFGLDAQQFKNVVNASFETYAAELSGVQAGTPELMKQAAKDIKETQSAGETMETALAAILSAVLRDVLPGIVRILDMVVNTVRAMMDFGGGFLRKLLGQDEMFMTPKEIAQKRKKENIESAKSALSSKNAVELENYLRQNPITPSNVLLGSFRPLPGGSPLMGRDNPDKIKVLEERNTDMKRSAEMKRRIDASDRKDKANGIGDVFDVDDSPVAMSASSRATPSAQVPTVEGKFETSMQDDVLLSRLAKLRDKIHEYRTKTTKVSLNVGMNNIAEATV